MHVSQRFFCRLVALQEIERLSAAELGKAAKVSLAEGDLTEERWTRYSARASQLVAEVNFPEVTRLAAAFYCEICGISTLCQAFC